MSLETEGIIFLSKERETGNKGERGREGETSYTHLLLPAPGNDQHLDVLSQLRLQKSHVAAENNSITQWRLKFQH